MKDLHYKGIGASIGIGLAPAYILKFPEFDIQREVVKDYTIEQQLYEDAIALSIKQLETIKELAEIKLGKDKADIFEAHIQLLNDPEIKNEILNLISDSKANAAYAVDFVYGKYYDIFSKMDDPYFKERSGDIGDVKKRILSNLLGIELPDILSINQEVVIVAHDLTPSETALLDKKFVKGFITDIGGRTSHAAIMARTMEIPAVLGLKDVSLKIKNNDLIAIDGSSGDVEINPSNVTLWTEKKQKFEQHQIELKKYVNQQTITLDGKHVHLEANIGNPQDTQFVKNNGSEGIGLYRSEFLYMANDHWPTEEEQYEGYHAVLDDLKDQLVVIRTLDIGGDKKIPYFQFPKELNPFLGYRAIRVSLDKKDVFKTQLRALGRASKHGKLAIMFPMIATVQEFIEAKEFTLKIFAELRKEGYEVADNVQIGMMVEVPSTAVLADKFAKYADFFSIGTNDLIQYTFACDRMSKEVSYLYQPNNPSLLRLIKMTIDGGHKYQH